MNQPLKALASVFCFFKDYFRKFLGHFGGLAERHEQRCMWVSGSNRPSGNRSPLKGNILRPIMIGLLYALKIFLQAEGWLHSSHEAELSKIQCFQQDKLYESLVKSTSLRNNFWLEMNPCNTSATHSQVSLLSVSSNCQNQDQHLCLEPCNGVTISVKVGYFIYTILSCRVKYQYVQKVFVLNWGDSPATIFITISLVEHDAEAQALPAPEASCRVRASVSSIGFFRLGVRRS